MNRPAKGSFSPILRMQALASLREAGSRRLSEACLDAGSRNASTIKKAKEPT